MIKFSTEELCTMRSVVDRRRRDLLRSTSHETDFSLRLLEISKKISDELMQRDLYGEGGSDDE